MNWKLSPKCRQSVVSDTATGHDSKEVIAGYGGHLVCESVAIESNRVLIAAAPAA